MQNTYDDLQALAIEFDWTRWHLWNYEMEFTYRLTVVKQGRTLTLDIPYEADKVSFIREHKQDFYIAGEDGRSRPR